MKIDDALAKGLAKQLISWWKDDLSNAISEFKKNINPSMLLNKDGLLKVKELHKFYFKRFTISYLNGGSKKRPYIAFVGIHAIKDRPYEQWKEAGVFGESVIVNFCEGKQIGESNLAPFAIGEHCISRVFQRSGLVNEENISNPYSILPEFQFIPLWAAFWDVFYRELQFVHGEEFLGLNVLIPSDQGLFFAKINMVELNSFVEVRTYVHISQLDESQKEIMKIFLNASKYLENSLISAYPTLPALVDKDVTTTEIAMLYVLMKYRIKDYSDQICLMLVGENNNFNYYKIKKVFDKFLNDASFNSDIEYLLNSVLMQGYEKYSSEFTNPASQMRASFSMGNN